MIRVLRALGTEPTPERPGPGPIPESLLKALELTIARRVEGIFAGGFVEEVEALLDRGLAESRTASRAIGYREVMGYLAGDRSLVEAIEQTTVATRRFARRQDSWFRKDPRIVWVAYDDPDRVEKAVGVVKRLSG